MMNSVEKLNSILDISEFPNKFTYDEAYDIAFVLTKLNEDQVSGYIPKEILGLLNFDYKGSPIFLFDSEPKTTEGFKFVPFANIETLFSDEVLEDFMQETGLWGFVIESKLDGSFIVGLDHEYLILLSPKDNGFITRNGGKETFLRIVNKQFLDGICQMPRSSFKALTRFIYNL